jgi:hypothetical protein
MLRRIAFTMILLLVLAGSACKPKTTTTSEGTPSPSASPSPSESAAAGGHDCNKLATATEVSGIYGVTVSSPTHSETAALGIPGSKAEACHYAAQTGDVGFSFGVGPDVGTVGNIFQQSKQSQNGATVTGIGDDAYFAADVHNLLVIKGTQFISVGYSAGSGDEKELKADVNLANKVLTKLGA